MRTFISLTKRNVKIFFKDKGMLFTSLITPIILLVLYSTFLAKIYRDSFQSSLPSGIEISEKLVSAIVSGQLVSSLLAVSCVTVAFCSNTLMAEDRVKKTVDDLLVSPLKKTTLALSYFASTLLATLIVTYLALGVCFIYVAATGWFLSVGDVFLLILDVFLLTMFGSAFSSVINFFLKTQGQVSGVGTVISAGYGFLCGAYMPLASFSNGLRNAMMFLPGTYGTSLLRNHALNGALLELRKTVPAEAVEGIKKSMDCSLEFFSNFVPLWAMYLVLILSIVVFMGIYLLLSFLRKRKDA